MFKRSCLAVGAALLFASGACGESEPVLEMTIVGTEMAFEAPAAVQPGRYEVTFRNAGAVAHELAFENPGGQIVMRRSIGGGQSVVLDVDLSQEGTWELGCYEPGHFEAGMVAPLSVEKA